MLSLPEGGLKRSVNKHNSRFDVLCDWIEASVLFYTDELSLTDVLDRLMEESIYDDEDFCRENLNSAFRHIRTRLEVLGDACPVEFDGQIITRNDSWESYSVHAFCLLLFIKHYYSEWDDSDFGDSYVEQGELFELIVKDVVAEIFPDWNILLTGWSRDNASDIRDVAHAIADELKESVGDIDKWASDKANECGVDLVWYKKFSDTRGGYPVYLAQCASGKDWTKKLHTPELGLWMKLLDFKLPPAKAFAMPFALQETEFTQISPRVQGLILDRYRLLISSREEEWLTENVRVRVQDWVRARLDWFLERAA